MAKWRDYYTFKTLNGTICCYQDKHLETINGKSKIVNEPMKEFYTGSECYISFMTINQNDTKKLEHFKDDIDFNKPINPNINLYCITLQFINNEYKPYIIDYCNSKEEFWAIYNDNNYHKIDMLYFSRIIEHYVKKFGSKKEVEKKVSKIIESRKILHKNYLEELEYEKVSKQEEYERAEKIIAKYIKK